MNPTNSLLLYLTTKKMDLHLIKLKLPIIALIICVSFHSVISDMAKDRQECTAALTGLATCLPYVQGTSKAPTPDCCSGLKQVLNTNKKCLCVIVIDGNSPDMGLGINVTLALGLPSVCSAPANVSQCPALLHLAPNSPEAQIFHQFGHASSSIAGSPVGSPFPSVGPSGSSTGKGKNSGGSGHYSGRRWKALKAIISGLLITLNILIWN